jgi:multicomponent Na+:H+ antiporter subunit G
MLQTTLHILTIAAMVFGLFFLFVGALGVYRFPDFYHRLHAASKCITLGIAGLLVAIIFHLSAVSAADPNASVMAAITKAVLVILFQFVAAPVGAHVLSRAAHLDGIEQWKGTLSDELAEDKAAGLTGRGIK